MTNESRGDDSPFGPFTEFLESLAGGSTPSSPLSPDIAGQFLEMQRAAMQQMFGKSTGGGEEAGFQREAMKALMRCSLELMQSTRTYRESFIEAQSTLVKRYVELLDEAMDKPEASRASQPVDDEPKSG